MRHILGDNYYTAYQPKDDNDNIIGVLFIGIPTETLDNIIEKHDKRMDKINISIVLLRTISLGVLIALVSILLSRESGEDTDSDDTLETLPGGNGGPIDTTDERLIEDMHGDMAGLFEDTRGVLKNIALFSKEISDISEHSSEQLKKLTEELNQLVERLEI